jgi:hypothetical protein
MLELFWPIVFHAFTIRCNNTTTQIGTRRLLVLWNAASTKKYSKLCPLSNFTDWLLCWIASLDANDVGSCHGYTSARSTNCGCSGPKLVYRKTRNAIVSTRFLLMQNKNMKSEFHDETVIDSVSSYCSHYHSSYSYYSQLSHWSSSLAFPNTFWETWVPAFIVLLELLSVGFLTRRWRETETEVDEKMFYRNNSVYQKLHSSVVGHQKLIYWKSTQIPPENINVNVYETGESPIMGHLKARVPCSSKKALSLVRYRSELQFRE